MGWLVQPSKTYILEGPALRIEKCQHLELFLVEMALQFKKDTFKKTLFFFENMHMKVWWKFLCKLAGPGMKVWCELAGLLCKFDANLQGCFASLMQTCIVLWKFDANLQGLQGAMKVWCKLAWNLQGWGRKFDANLHEACRAGGGSLIRCKLAWNLRGMFSISF